MGLLGIKDILRLFVPLSLGIRVKQKQGDCPNFQNDFQ